MVLIFNISNVYCLFSIHSLDKQSYASYATSGCKDIRIIKLKFLVPLALTHDINNSDTIDLYFSAQYLVLLYYSVHYTVYTVLFCTLHSVHYTILHIVQYSCTVYIMQFCPWRCLCSKFDYD